MCCQIQLCWGLRPFSDFSRVPDFRLSAWYVPAFTVHTERLSSLCCLWVVGWYPVGAWENCWQAGTKCVSWLRGWRDHKWRCWTSNTTTWQSSHTTCSLKHRGAHFSLLICQFYSSSCPLFKHSLCFLCWHYVTACGTWMCQPISWKASLQPAYQRTASAAWRSSTWPITTWQTSVSLFWQATATSGCFTSPTTSCRPSPPGTVQCCTSSELAKEFKGNFDDL